jgi:hypothetical protein
MVAVVGLAAKDPKNFTVKPDPQKFEGLFTWGKEFIGELLRSLRNIICKNNQLPRMSQYHVYPEAVFAAIAAEIMQRTGHTESMALGLATLILMILARITKEAFCKMTDDEVLKRFGILKLAVATRKLAIKRTAVAKKRAAAKKRKP